MSDVVIRVENLSKKYIIGHQKQESYTSFRDVISNGAKSLWQGLTCDRKENLGDRSEEFWALKDVSFEIKQGDRVGIIGCNGAGKSTLLKILSRITEPTSGRISIKGRVASLLEVGTGFHPELTGRENIYLNGAILGMHRFEIKKKFDEIVAFAEVEKFLDTPVKHYSSGMYVRLAFAVAAHLEPEILIVDEVLAVGDTQFQKKCLGKMEDVANREGRTVIFVSHNMGAIENLCTQSIFLKQGLIERLGKTQEVLDFYLGSLSSDSSSNSIDKITERQGLGEVQFKKIEYFIDGKPFNRLVTGQDTTIKLYFQSSNTHKIFKSCRIGIAIKSLWSELIVMSTEMVYQEALDININNSICFHIKRLPLSPGTYNFVLFLESNKVIQDWVKDGLSVEVEHGDYYGNNKNHPEGYAGKTVLIDFCCEKYHDS